MVGKPFFIFGDSHMRAITAAARLLKLDARGRPTMSGWLWDGGSFDLTSDGRLLVHNELGARFMAETMSAAGVDSLFDLQMPIVTTVPFQVHLLMRDISKAHSIDVNEPDKTFISRGFLKSLVLARRRKIIDLLAKLRSPERDVIVVCAPPRNRPVDFAMLMENIIIDELARVGIETMRTRDWSAGPDGLLLPEYAQMRRDGSGDDGIHGNVNYGAQVLDRAAQRLGLKRRWYEQRLIKLGSRAQREALAFAAPVVVSESAG